MSLCSNLTREQSHKIYAEVLRAKDIEGLRRLVLEDLFFLLVIACKRKDMDDDWLYARCREVEESPNGFLDLWSREHYKSTIITFGKTIQDILNNPEITACIFSHTRPIAKGFLEQIKRELECNDFLKDAFNDVLYQNPKGDSDSWSLDGGLLVKRKTNPKNKTLEAFGLVDGQPTGSHYMLLIYDDVVTRKSVSNPDQIKATTDAIALSYNLGARGGVVRGVGTPYHFNDTYRTIIERGTLIPRKYPATDDGTITGNPVLWTRELLLKKRKDMGPYVAACQLFMNPKEDSVMGFEESWLRFYSDLRNYHGWNHYILVDPAGEKKKQHAMDPDYTVIIVLALAPDGNIYFIDGVRDRLNLTERTKQLFFFHRKYKPLGVGYEKYGKDSDNEHIEYVMEQENYRFKITPLGGATAKNDRIRGLVPDFENGKIWLPYRHMFVNREGVLVDFIKSFLEDEYTAFPVAVHDDILDCMARIKHPDMNVKFPEEIQTEYPSVTMDRNVDRVETEYDIFA